MICCNCFTEFTEKTYLRIGYFSCFGRCSYYLLSKNKIIAYDCRFNDLQNQNLAIHGSCENYNTYLYDVISMQDLSYLKYFLEPEIINNVIRFDLLINKIKNLSTFA